MLLASICSPDSSGMRCGCAFPEARSGGGWPAREYTPATMLNKAQTCRVQAESKVVKNWIGTKGLGCWT